MIRAALLDFDGTLVTEDILDVVCGIVGKRTESEELKEAFHSGKVQGLSTLVQRINFLQGVTLSQIQKELEKEAYLMQGAKEFITYLKGKGIIIILASGNITPVLAHYQQLLGIDHIVGTQPRMDGDMIQGITEEEIPGREFKLVGCKKILEERGITPEETIAIGDSPADKILFDFAATSIVINPKGDSEQYADFTIHNDLRKAMEIIETL